MGEFSACGQTKSAFSTGGRTGRKQCPCPARGPDVCAAAGASGEALPLPSGHGPSPLERERGREKEWESQEGNGSLAGVVFSRSRVLPRARFSRETRSVPRMREREREREILNITHILIIHL